MSRLQFLLLLLQIENNIGVFPKWTRTFIEFSEFSKFREFNKSLKHELGSIYRSHRSQVSYWSLTQEVECSSPFTVMTKVFVTEFSELSESIEEKLPLNNVFRLKFDGQPEDNLLFARQDISGNVILFSVHY